MLKVEPAIGLCTEPLCTSASLCNFHKWTLITRNYGNYVTTLADPIPENLSYVTGMLTEDVRVRWEIDWSAVGRDVRACPRQSSRVSRVRWNFVFANDKPSGGTLQDLYVIWCSSINMSVFMLRNLFSLFCCCLLCPSESSSGVVCYFLIWWDVLCLQNELHRFNGCFDFCLVVWRFNHFHHEKWWLLFLFYWLTAHY